MDETRTIDAGTSRPALPGETGFQARVHDWMMACFNDEIAFSTKERNHRFLEEALELTQAKGCTASEAHQLVDYVFSREVGEPVQEVGGVKVCLAALCTAAEIDMDAAGETELARIWTKVEKIRAKHAAKPQFSPLPGFAALPLASGETETRKALEGERDWPGDDLDQLVGVLETIEYVAHNDIRANGMKAIWDFARYAQGIVPRIRSALIPTPSVAEAAEPGEFVAFQSEINPDVWYVGNERVAFLRTEVGAGNSSDIAKRAAAGLNATRPAPPPVVPSGLEALVERLLNQMNSRSGEARYEAGTRLLAIITALIAERDEALRENAEFEREVKEREGAFARKIGDETVRAETAERDLSEQAGCVDIDGLAYRFWSIHPKELDVWKATAPDMPKGYKGGIRAWFFACEMRRAMLSARIKLAERVPAEQRERIK